MMISIQMEINMTDKFKEELKFFDSICEELQEDVENLMEMANLEPEETGLDYLIWIGPSPSVHEDRIKVILEKGKVTSKNSFSISIEDEPKVVAGKADISAKELKKIINWIKQNKDILIKHAKSEITDRQFRKNMKK